MEDLGISEITTEIIFKYTGVCKRDTYWLRVNTRGGLFGIPNNIWSAIKGK